MSQVVVIGDLILDRTVECRIKGFAQEAHNTVMVDEVWHSSYLGGAGHVHRCLLALNRKSELLGFVGPDIAAKLTQQGHTPYMTLDQFACGDISLKTRYVTPAGQLFRCDVDQRGIVPRNYWDGDTFCAKRLRALLPKTSLLCFVDYGKGVFADGSNLRGLQMLASEHQCRMLVDPGRLGNWGRYATPYTYFKANAQQALVFSKHYRLTIDSVEDPIGPEYDANEDYGPGYCRSVGLKVYENMKRIGMPYRAAVITCGASGMTLILPDGSIFAFANANPVPVIDTTGAGDVVMATLAHCLADRSAPMDADAWEYVCTLADKAARISVGHRGCYAPTMKEVTNCG